MNDEYQDLYEPCPLCRSKNIKWAPSEIRNVAMGNTTCLDCGLECRSFKADRLVFWNSFAQFLRKLVEEKRIKVM